MNSLLPDQEPPRDVLAGEYVLGLHSLEQRQALEQRLAGDAAFAGAVAQWQAHLAPLLDEIPAVDVPERVWVRIRASLLLTPVPPRTAPAVPTQAPSFWDDLKLWRWLGAGGLATAAACLLVLLNVRTPAPTPAPAPPPVATVPSTPAPTGVAMTATLATADGRPGYVALMDADKRRITVTPLDRTPTAGKVPELWLVTPDGKAHSLGLFDEQRSRMARIPDALMPMLGEDALLAVTLEPPGGAPGGIATGAVVAKGGITALTLAP